MTAPKEGSIVKDGFRIYPDGKRAKMLRMPPTLKGMFPEFSKKLVEHCLRKQDTDLDILLTKAGLDPTPKKPQGRRAEPLPVNRPPAREADSSALIDLATAQADEWERWAKETPLMQGDPVRLAKTLQRVVKWRQAIAAAKGKQNV